VSGKLVKPEGEYRLKISKLLGRDGQKVGVEVELDTEAHELSGGGDQVTWGLTELKAQLTEEMKE
jgi:hypothetical protein